MRLNLRILIFHITFLFSIGVYAQSINQVIALTPLENENISLEQFKGNIVIISILSPDNTIEIKKLDKLAGKYANHKIIFVLVTDENDRNDAELLDHSLLNYKQLTQSENDLVFNTYQTGMFKVFPIHIIINPEGNVAYKRKGTIKNIEKKLEKRINAILNDVPSFETNKPAYVFTKNN